MAYNLIYNQPAWFGYPHTHIHTLNNKIKNNIVCEAMYYLETSMNGVMYDNAMAMYIK